MTVRFGFSKNRKYRGVDTRIGPSIEQNPPEPFSTANKERAVKYDSVAIGVVRNLLEEFGMSLCDGVRRIVVLGMLLSLVGCGGSQSPFAPIEGRGKAPPPPVPPKANTTRPQNIHTSIKLTLDGPVVARKCHASLATGMPGRPDILQMTSYEGAGRESFPSILLRAEVTATSLASLNGLKVPAELFVQQKAEEPVWCCLPGQPVEIEIYETDDTKISVEVLRGELTNTSTGQSVKVTGDLKGAAIGD